MFMDTRLLAERDTLDADLCVIGAGAAGIPITWARPGCIRTRATGSSTRTAAPTLTIVALALRLADHLRAACP